MEQSKLLGHPSISALPHWNICLFCRGLGWQPKGFVRLRTIKDGTGGNASSFPVVALNVPLLHLWDIFVKRACQTKEKWWRLYVNGMAIQLLDVDDAEQYCIHLLPISEMGCTPFSLWLDDNRTHNQACHNYWWPKALFRLFHL